MTELNLIGKRIPPIDGYEKVIGKTRFASDFDLPGMLHARILRSSLPHARIRSISTEKAKALKGVRAVVTAADAPFPLFGLDIRDEHFFASDEVYYVGDEIGAVIAETERIALEALELIEVDLEPLPAVFDPLEALKPDSPLARGDRDSNVCRHLEINRGDIELGFKQADFIEEETYSISHQYAAYIEPISAAASWTEDRLTVYAPHHGPFPLSKYICDAFSIPVDSFQFIQTRGGGSFGEKNYMRTCALAAILAKVANAPVRISLEREEDFACSKPAVPMIIRLRMGVRWDGTITAKEAHIVADNGAYTASAARVMGVAAIRPDAAYRNKNIRCVADCVYTNRVGTSAIRGFGNPQMNFAVESMLDRLAERIGMDPAELRLKNATREGDTTAHGYEVMNCALREAIAKAMEVSNWNEKRAAYPGRSRGIGLACGVHVSGNVVNTPDYGSIARVVIKDNATVEIHTSEGDIGQGANTVFALVAAEELGLQQKDVTVAQMNSDMTNFGAGAEGSYVTAQGGHAVRLAALDAKRQLMDVVSREWGCPATDVRLEGGRFVNIRSEKEMDVQTALEIYRDSSGETQLTGWGEFKPEGLSAPDKSGFGNPSLAYPFCAHVAEVEVDRETGRVTVLRYIAVHDSGRILNPIGAEGQVEGSVLQGLGWALMEEYIFQNGRIVNSDFTNYRVPTIMDSPDIEVLFVGTPDPRGPYGAKSIAEAALNPVVPAIVSAVRHATGAKATTLPLTPERLLLELAAK
jgi:CO/xanthine dehydrogenase Mo-binding subunit